MLMDDAEEEFEQTKFLCMHSNPDLYQKIFNKDEKENVVEHNSNRSQDPTKRNEDIHKDIIKIFGRGFSELKRDVSNILNEWEDDLDTIDLVAEEYDLINLDEGEEEDGA